MRQDIIYTHQPHLLFKKEKVVIKMLQKEYTLAIFSIISWASAAIDFKPLITDLDFKSATFFFLLFGALAMFVYLAITNWRSIIDIRTKHFGLIIIIGGNSDENITSR